MFVKVKENWRNDDKMLRHFGLKNKHFFCLLTLIFLFSTSLLAQTDSVKLRFFEPAPYPHKTRIISLSTSLSLAYAGTMTGLNYIWYSDSQKSKFHFFNDAREWQQVDKLGHFHTTYFESVWATKMLRWSGVPNKKASIYGSLLGFGFQSSIEIFDGFSEKWGASWSDIGFNALGSGFGFK